MIQPQTIVGWRPSPDRLNQPRALALVWWQPQWLNAG